VRAAMAYAAQLRQQGKCLLGLGGGSSSSSMRSVLTVNNVDGAMHKSGCCGGDVS
jgi:hypothetical protein